MNRMKFAFAAVAALIGIGGAYASKVKAEAYANRSNHTWVDNNNKTIMLGTTADAETACPGTGVFCLRASDAPTLIVYKSN